MMDEPTSDASPLELVYAQSVPPAVNALGEPVNVADTIKLAPLSSSNESDGDDYEQAATSTGAGGGGGTRSSPVPNCAICLSRCKNKCYTDSCMHQFCFKCLCEWSKIKPECPLCKQPFKSIKHNVRSQEQYDRYNVETNQQLPERPNSARFLYGNYRRPNVLVPMYRTPIVLDEDSDATQAVGRYEPYRQEMLNIYRQEQQEANASVSTSQLWRCCVYDRKLYAMPVADSATGRFRDWSARFYRENPAQIHRLMPWINRDIVCLLRNTTHNVSDVMLLITELLPISNILDPTFRRRLTPYLGERTGHFIHELFNFARSPYDMVGYDRVVQYSTFGAEDNELDYISSEDDDAEHEEERNAEDLRSNSSNRRRDNSSTSVIVSNPSAGTTHSFSVSVSSDGIMQPTLSIRSSANGMQSAAINLSIHSRSSDVIEIDDAELDANAEAAANAEVAAINNGNTNSSRRHAGAALPITDHIELNSSDPSGSSSSDDCEFVLERKPPHLRTPELVSLNSESDSDVVFIEETKPDGRDAPKTNDTAVGEHDNPNQNENLYMGASTSSGVCSNTGKSWRKILHEAQRRQRHGQRSLRSDPKSAQARPLHHQRADSSSSSSTSTTSSSNIFSSNSSSSSDSDSGDEYRTDMKKSKRPRKTARSKSKASKEKNNRAKGGHEANVEQKSGALKRHSRKTRKSQVKRRKVQNKDSSDDSSSDSSTSSSSSSSTSSDSSLDAINLKQLKQKLQKQLNGDASNTSIDITDPSQWLKTECTEDANFNFGDNSEPACSAFDNQMLMTNVRGTPTRSSSTSTTSSDSSSSSSTSSSTTTSLNLSNDKQSGDHEATQQQHVSMPAHEDTISLMDYAAYATHARQVAGEEDDEAASTSTSTYAANSSTLAYEAQLPIFSDISSDVPPSTTTSKQQTEPNTELDIEPADIDVGVDSLF